MCKWWYFREMALPSTGNIYRQLLAVARLGRRAYRPYKKQIVILTALGFLGGIVEGIGINALIPLLTFVLGLQDPATDALSVAIRAFFEWIHVPFVPKFLLSFIVILFIAKAAIALLLNYIQIGITTAYERETRSRLFSIVLRASWPYLLKQKLGNLETALMIDTPAAMSLLNKLSLAIMLVTSLMMYAVVAFSISPLVTLTTLVLGVIIFVTLRPLMDKVHAISSERASIYRDTLHHVTEHVAGLKTVKALGVEDHAIKRGNVLFESIRGFAMRVGVLHGFSSQLVAPVGVLYIAGILALAFKTPFISLAALPAILYLIYRIFTYVQQLQNNLQYMSELAPHLERVVLYEGNAKESEERGKGDKSFIFERELVFKDVSFAYEGGSDVLHDISFTIPKGKMIGLVGPSGAGKTTTVDLMLRLIEPTRGTIQVDGVEGNTIALADWRANVGYVSQDFFLLHDTIRNNIRFYEAAMTDEQIWEAAKLAHIDEFIRRSPKGLDTMVGDRGIRLSAGERQRIVIARTLARKPTLLILDEATSALDNESEAHIKGVINELKGRVTIVAIAHRLTTIMDSDELIVLQGGRVVETGSPKTLLADPGSYFYKVYSINQ